MGKARGAASPSPPPCETRLDLRLQPRTGRVVREPARRGRRAGSGHNGRVGIIRPPSASSDRSWRCARIHPSHRARVGDQPSSVDLGAHFSRTAADRGRHGRARGRKDATCSGICADYRQTGHRTCRALRSRGAGCVCTMDSHSAVDHSHHPSADVATTFCRRGSCERAGANRSGNCHANSHRRAASLGGAGWTSLPPVRSCDAAAGRRITACSDSAGNRRPALGRPWLVVVTAAHDSVHSRNGDLHSDHAQE